jgi:hypothetical protein
MEGSMAGTGKPSIVAAFIVAWGLVGLVPTAAMAQFPIPMIPNFNFGPQHYRSGSSHYSTHSHSSRHEEEKQAPVDKTKEKDATQPPDPTASASTQPRQQPLSGPPRDAASHDAPPPAGPSAAANPPPAQKANDDQPAFQPSR